MRSSVSKGAALAAILIVLLIVAAFGWKTVKGGATEGKVEIDISKVKENMKSGKFGGH